MEKVLLTGHRKSGTSLLGKLFNGYPEADVLVYPTDITLLYGGYDPFFYSRSIEEFRNGFFRIAEETMRPYDGIQLADQQPPFSFDRFHRGLTDQEDLIAAIRSRNDLVDIAAKAFAATLDSKNPKKFIFKETSQLIHAKDLVGPTDKALTIFRDPRDVFSAIKDGFPPYYSANGEGLQKSLQSVLFRYRVDYLAYLEVSKTETQPVQAIRFEDLVNDPEHAMQGVCEFLEMPFHPDLLRPTDGDSDYRGNTYGAVAIPTGQISAKNVGRWRERLNNDEVKIIEFFLGDVLEALGYERSVVSDSPSRAVSEHYRAMNSEFFFKNPKLESFFTLD